MPELPEVETIKIGLEKYLVGHKILGIEVREPKIFQGEKKDVVGTEIKSIKRIGKGLIVELNNEFALAIHLKLTGQIIYRDKKTENLPVSDRAGGGLPSNLTRVIIELDKDAFLYYNDLRKFGWIKVIKKDAVKNLPFFKEMGPEPFKDLTFEKFKEIVSVFGSPIKIVLMDQKKIGGIGNIYANEALFEAGIDPRRKAKSLNDSEIKRLYDAILLVLKRGIEYGGSSDVNFVNALGQNGKYQEHFLVYGRTGESCKRCDGTVKRIVLGGRGTFFCPACQH